MESYPLKFTEGQDPVSAYDSKFGKPGADCQTFNPPSTEVPHKVSFRLTGGGGK